MIFKIESKGRYILFLLLNFSKTSLLYTNIYYNNIVKYLSVFMTIFPSQSQDMTLCC